MPDQRSLPQDLLQGLRSVAGRLSQAYVLTADSIAVAHEYLLARLANVPGNQGLQVLQRRKRRGVLTSARAAILRSRPAIAFVGSDGAGKTSVISAIAEKQMNVVPMVAKKLYRRSLIYQLGSGLAKRLHGTNRDRFDSLASIPIVFRALTAAWSHAVFR